MDKTLPNNAGNEGSIPGQGAKIPHASWPKNQNRNSIATNSIKTFKMVKKKKKFVAEHKSSAASMSQPLGTAIP